MAALITSMCVYRNIRQIVGVLGCQRRLSSFCREQNGFLIIHNSSPNQKFVILTDVQGCRHKSQTSWGSKNTDATGMTGVAARSSKKQIKNDSADQGQIKKDADKTEESKEEKKVTWKEFFMQHGYKFLLASLLGSGVMLVGEWGAPVRDAEGQIIKDEFSELYAVEAYLRRAYKEVFHQVTVTREPSRRKLLPDPLQYPYIQPKYTVVMEMTDILVHPEWTYETGWRFKKRPGIDHFLKTIGPPTFEVVVFTKEQGMTADPIITKIDPENFIMYRLYRDATRYEEGVHIKDLNCLNRDLSKVIFLDWNKQACQLNKENLFAMKRWQGEESDTELGELASFIQAIAQTDVDDVRPVLQYYSQFDEPLQKFEENKRKQLEELEKLKDAFVQKENQSLTKKFTKMLW